MGMAYSWPMTEEHVMTRRSLLRYQGATQYGYRRRHHALLQTAPVNSSIDTWSSPVRRWIRRAATPRTFQTANGITTADKRLQGVGYMAE